MNTLKIKDDCRANLNKYTRKAFDSIPKIENPNILDLGCGTGVPTIEIANWTNGNMVAIDSDKNSIDWFKEKIKILNLENKISIIHDSFFNLDYPKNYFDIIIAEGLFNIIGFEKGISSFSIFLKPKGYFLIHDEIKNREKKLKIFEKYHYKLVYSFILDEKIWWDQYVSCLEKRIKSFEKDIENDAKSNTLFQQLKSEIKMYKQDPMSFRSIYYVLKKL